MKTHEYWIHRLSEYLDGELDAQERAAFQLHRSECGECDGAVRALRAVVDRARALPEVMPERDLWSGIAEGIAAREHATAPSAGPALSRPVIEFPTAHHRARRAGVWVTVPQLSAAAAVLVLLSVGLAWATGSGASAAGETSVTMGAPSGVMAVERGARDRPPESIAGDLADLEILLSAERATLDPNTVRILEKNLAVIERAIEDSRNALALDPENGFLQKHLDRAYERKLSYLREASRISEWAG